MSLDTQNSLDIILFVASPSKPGVVFLRSHCHPFSLHKSDTSVLYPAPMPINDPIKQREASRRHYEKNRDRVIAKAKEYSKLTRDRIRTFISDYLKTNPCVDCGEANTIVLEFDHIGDDKHFNLSDAARKGVSMKKLKDEIAKCEVRCANCHRKKTYERSGWTHKN